MEIATLLIKMDKKKGMDMTFKGEWNRRMLKQVEHKMYRFHRQYKAEIRREADERARKESKPKPGKASD